MLVYNDFVADIRVHKEARDLTAAGHEVLVVATRSRASLPEHEVTSAGYEVRRVPISARWRTELRGPLDRVADRPTSWLGRAVDAVRQNPVRRRIVADRNRKRFGNGAREVVAAWRPDAVHAHDLDTLEAGVDLGRRLPTPVVYDSHELWRANNFIQKLPGRYRRRWQRLETELVGRVDAIILTTEGRAEQFRQWYPGTDPIVVMNCQDGAPTPRTRWLCERLPIGDDARVLIYQGLVHRDRGVFVALDALERLGPPYVYVAIGPGGDVAELRREIERRGLSDRAFVLDPVSHDDLADVTASADIGLSLVQNTSLSYYLSAPNKLFEFMRAGLPIVASDFPEVRRVFEGGDLGELVDPASADAVVEAVRRIDADPDRASRIERDAHRLLSERYSWRAQMHSVLVIYEWLASRSGARAARTDG